MRAYAILFALAALPTRAAAADLAILDATVRWRSAEVLVEMSVPNPPISAETAQWEVAVNDANHAPIAGITVTKVSKGLTDQVVLAISASPQALQGWTELLVTYKPGGSKTFRFLSHPGEKAKTIVGADSKDDADVYVSGSYSPRIHAPAQYSYDIAIGYGLPYFSKAHPERGRIGLSITGAADQRPNLDPDSYYAGAFWQAYPVRMPHGPLQGVVFQLDTGGEFAPKKFGDTKTKTHNFLAPAPRFEFPMRLYPWPGHSVSGVFLTLRPVAGFDWGTNFQNAAMNHGSGAIARALAGADLTVTYKPKKLFRYSFSASSSWRGRYLLRDEIDTTSVYNAATKDFDFTFQTTRKPRNHLSSKFDWKWTEFVGVTVSHELGAAPPLFNYIDHKVAIGLTFSATFAKDAVQRHQ